MSSNRSIAKIYKENHRSFLYHLKKAKELDESVIHKLRVDIKNIRVLVALLKKLSREKIRSKRLFKLISPVFGNAGDIRTTTLNLKLTKNSRSKLVLKFQEHLKKQNKKAEDEFLKTLKDFDKKKFNKYTETNHSILKKLNAKEVQQKTIDQLNKALEEVRTSFSETESDKDLHEIRKQIKTIKNLGIILKDMDSVNPFSKSLEKTDLLYKKIGDWHDSVMLVDDLEDFAKAHKKLKPTLKNNLFIDKLKTKNKKNKSLIIKELHI